MLFMLSILHMMLVVFTVLAASELAGLCKNSPKVMMAWIT